MGCVNPTEGDHTLKEPGQVAAFPEPKHTFAVVQSEIDVNFPVAILDALLKCLPQGLVEVCNWARCWLGVAALRQQPPREERGARRGRALCCCDTAGFGIPSCVLHRLLQVHIDQEVA
eukprot:CAMPEP_0171125522 /NCGR_PEP_ID=MMETSP0766_2-20121228/111397_1 /TAXON_ID=439317 /ORGANISM="Gambierdiscus australes, Strain CAWD 149" /LENGTH=117 /DNA_ID=CAMNT_0011588511 /DNA_START=71 /DNA_END=420 /DNA_ORIENTATION=+